ncbi:hypothetical protein Btru_077062 [Bulinus truncatus]|nr:hypothetical protein Btru_077062 [Bulinus truncatus]
MDIKWYQLTLSNWFYEKLQCHLFLETPHKHFGLRQIFCPLSNAVSGNSKQNRTMLLVRVLLGDVYVYSTKHKETTQLIRPPCKYCYKDKCSCPNQSLFDSVMLDGKCLFREFVVYDKNQCYPEYVITYRRV